MLTRGLKKANGAVTLLMTVVTVTLLMLILFLSSQKTLIQEKITSNQNRSMQAYLAAQAGIQFAANYYNDNYSTITATASGGYISYTNASLTGVTLSNGSQFSATLSNPVQNNLNIIDIISIGTSDDGSSTYTIHQLFYHGSTLVNAPTVPFRTRDEIEMSGNATITNTTTGTTIQAGDDVELEGNAKTVLSTGTSSTRSVTNSDIQQNSSTLANMSQNSFFSSYFGASTASVKAKFVNYYSNSSNTNYSSTLNGKSGTTIWIDQTNGTATINGNTTIGSASNPVILVVNGQLNLSGNVTLYGFIFVLGNSESNLAGNVTINGGMATSGEMEMNGNANITFNPTVLGALQNNANLAYTAAVPGSWRDF